jgi:hypothetical protein
MTALNAVRRGLVAALQGLGIEVRSTWSETPAMLPMKPFTIFDASITLSLSDVSE